MFKETFTGRYRLSLLTILTLMLGVLYVIIPFDAISDFIPVLGWIDDAAVLFFVIKRLNVETQRFVREKAMSRKH